MYICIVQYEYVVYDHASMPCMQKETFSMNEQIQTHTLHLSFLSFLFFLYIIKLL